MLLTHRQLINGESEGQQSKANVAASCKAACRARRAKARIERRGESSRNNQCLFTGVRLAKHHWRHVAATASLRIKRAIVAEAA